ncbi:MAG: tetratricopeptide repeat protein [Flavobacteriaceae bacterium]|nr:tetratricopeptide repeat protein [Flavobacteriaceae bacterium]
MATYKKRGKKAKKGSQQNIEANSTTAEVFNTLDETASKSEKWIEKNSKVLFSGLIFVLAIILGYGAYKKYIQEPREIEAADELAYSKRFFDQAQNNTVAADSLYNLALSGTDGKYGLLDIIDTYGGTNAGNLAKYMAGISYLKMRDYENAIDQLSNFSTEDQVLGALALGNIGDAFAEINQPEEALEYYEKAADFKSNEFTSPIYLMKAGRTAMDLNEFKKAETLFTKIKDNFSTSDEAKEIDAFIQRARFAQQ